MDERWEWSGFTPATGNKRSLCGSIRRDQKLKRRNVNILMVLISVRWKLRKTKNLKLRGIQHTSTEVNLTFNLLRDSISMHVKNKQCNKSTKQHYTRIVSTWVSMRRLHISTSGQVLREYWEARQKEHFLSRANTKTNSTSTRHRKRRVQKNLRLLRNHSFVLVILF